MNYQQAYNKIKNGEASSMYKDKNGEWQTDDKDMPFNITTPTYGTYIIQNFASKGY